MAGKRDHSSTSPEPRPSEIERSIAEYYDAFSKADRDEESRWGEFALRQFPGQE